MKRRYDCYPNHLDNIFRLYKKFRCIYSVKSFTYDGECVMCRFARNKRVAEKIARTCKRGELVIRKITKAEWYEVDPDDVEG